MLRRYEIQSSKNLLKGKNWEEINYCINQEVALTLGSDPIRAR